MAAATRSVRQGPLLAEDWTTRALELLMDEGVSAVKISRLCSDLGVTKGSFYWRFDDLRSFKEAIAEQWCADSTRLLGEMAELSSLEPLERLRTMMVDLLDDRTWSVQRALRDWGRTDEQVAATLRASDTFVFELVEKTLQELGIAPSGARLRAGVLVYAGIGFAHDDSGLPKPAGRDIDEMIAFLAQGVPPVSGD